MAGLERGWSQASRHAGASCAFARRSSPASGPLQLRLAKRAVFAEILRVLRPGGRLQLADIANGRPVPIAAICDIDLWTG